MRSIHTHDAKQHAPFFNEIQVVGGGYSSTSIQSYDIRNFSLKAFSAKTKVNRAEEEEEEEEE